MGENDETGGHRYSSNLSNYFYNKVSSVENINEITNNADFSASEITNQGLNVVNNKIDVSTTRKLIKYLKSLIRVNVDKLNEKIDDKLDVVDYVVDDELKNDSENPVANYIIKDGFDIVTNTLNNKSNLGHTHDINDVNSLNNILNTKATTTALTTHTDDTDNPHNVTLSQLGIEDSGLITINFPQSDMMVASAKPTCRKYGKMVILSFNAEMYKEYKYSVAIFRLPNDCKPSTPIQSFAYKGGTGECFTYYIDANGDVKFGTTIPANTRVRIYECFFTS